MRTLLIRLALSLLLGFLVPTAAICAPSPALPIRGLFLGAPKPDEVPLLVRFIREALPKEGVNLLVLEIDYRYQYTSHLEVVDADALSKSDVKAIVSACRNSGVRLIPLIDLLGHQSWAEKTSGLLRAYPDFDETPGKYPNNKDIYCRSYCPLHPALHKVVFELIDELADVCEADAVHVGMDEVFILGDADCPRCKSRNRAELFAQEVRTLHDHLLEMHREMWMWGDRFIDGSITGVGKWEGSENGTASALNLVPRDIVICDWHYKSVPATAARFAVEGFRVLYAPTSRSEVALGELDLVKTVRAHADSTIAPRMVGILYTTWVGATNFIEAYNAGTPLSTEDSSPGLGDIAKRSARAALTFKVLFSAIRAMP